MNEWDLPQREGIRFSDRQLLALDHVLTTERGLMMKTLDELVEEWGDFRLNLWKALDDCVEDEPLGVIIPVTQSEAAVLLAAVPSQITWGDGFNHAFDIKLKLSQFLLGTYEDEKDSQARKKAEKAIAEAEAAQEKERTEAEEALRAAQERIDLLNDEPNLAARIEAAAGIIQDWMGAENADSTDETEDNTEDAPGGATAQGAGI